MKKVSGFRRFPVPDDDPVLVKSNLEFLFAFPFEFPDIFYGDGHIIARAVRCLCKAPDVSFFGFSGCHGIRIIQRIIIRFIIR